MKLSKDYKFYQVKLADLKAEKQHDLRSCAKNIGKIAHD